MYFVIFGTDKPGTGQQRRDTLDDVVSYVKNHPGHPDVTVHHAGPTLDDGGAINGTVNIVEAPSLEAARAFAADNPIQRLGLGELNVRQLDWKTGRPD